MSICAPFTGWRIHMSYGSPALFKVRVPRCLSVEFSLSKLVSVSNKSWTFQIKSSLLNLFAHTSLSCFISKLFLIHVLHDEEKNWIASNTLQIRFSTTIHIPAYSRILILHVQHNTADVNECILLYVAGTSVPICINISQCDATGPISVSLVFNDDSNKHFSNLNSFIVICWKNTWKTSLKSYHILRFILARSQKYKAWPKNHQL